MASPRRLRIVPLRCESLEQRITPAFAIPFATPDPVWNVGGTRHDDTIVIQRDPAHSTALIATVNGTVVSHHALAGLKVVNVRGGQGNDNISVDPSVPRRLSFRLYGGAG